MLKDKQTDHLVSSLQANKTTTMDAASGDHFGTERNGSHEPTDNSNEIYFLCEVYYRETFGTC
jgi:hypothetical protein